MDNIKYSEKKEHWETVFKTKDTSKVSWYQPVPETSLRLISKLQLPEQAKIIEVGSGDSYLADYLVDTKFRITLLDISGKALDTIKTRLGKKGKNIEFLECDILNLNVQEKFDVWHDRAVFHFLTNQQEVDAYLKKVAEYIKPGGYLIISTFSENGPDKCSGLQVQQYSADKLEELFHPFFEKQECFTENHNTPSGGYQNFVFCVFQRKG